jgi:Zinc finger, C3HC4 type (RING finger)
VISFEFIYRSSSEDDDTFRLVSVRDFSRYYTIVRRLSDLYASQKCQDSTDTEGESNLDSSVRRVPWNDCVICCDQPSNSVLPCCSNCICDQCEIQWVRKRLACPFCRTKFTSIRQVRNSGWHISDLSENELQGDIDRLLKQLEEFWLTCSYRSLNKVF